MKPFSCKTLFDHPPQDCEVVQLKKGAEFKTRISSYGTSGFLESLPLGRPRKRGRPTLSQPDTVEVSNTEIEQAQTYASRL